MEQTGPESVVFRVHRAENQRKCLPTAYKPQLITRRSLVQVQTPQPNKKAPRIFRGVFVFEIMMGKMIFRIVIRFSEGRQRTAPRRGGSTTPPPLLRKRGTERGIRTTPIAHSKTDETVVSWVFLCPESLLTHILTQTRKGPERFRKRPRGHSPSHRLPAAGLWWSHGRRCPG